MTATNNVGIGAASGSSNSITPAGLPFAPYQVVADGAVNGTARVSFSGTFGHEACQTCNGSTITSYTVTSSPGGITATDTDTPIIVTGLTNGVAYTFTVAATNGVGTGPASTPTNSVTPVALNGIALLTNVTVNNLHADGARIDFSPFAGAQDYRAYQVDSNGNPTQNPPIYFCAGKLTAQDAANNQAQYLPEIPIISAQVGDGCTRTLNDLTMGYVNTAPGTGLVPVYGVGSPIDGEGGDDVIFMFGRKMVYTTDQGAYQNYLSLGWQDRGIVYYIPDPMLVPTEPVNTIDSVYTGWQHSEFYVLQGSAEYNIVKSSAVPALKIFANPAPGRVPLNRLNGNTLNDTLWPGGLDSSFANAFNEGSRGLMQSISVSGIIQPTRFAVEALDSGCPFQGANTAMSTPLDLPQVCPFPGNPQVPNNPAGQPQGVEDIGSIGCIPHYAWYTTAQLASINPNGVYLNGQFNPNNVPHAIGRSFVTITPTARQPIIEPPANPPVLEGDGTWDYFINFGTLSSPLVFTSLPSCGIPNTTNCWGAEAFGSSIGTAYFNATIGGLRSVGVNNGQLNLRLADVGSDVNGIVQLPLNTQAQFSGDPTKFLHLTYDTQVISENRRYGQTQICDSTGAPLYHLNSNNKYYGNCLVLQSQEASFNGQGSSHIEIEHCSANMGRTLAWQVNDQCGTALLGNSYDIHNNYNDPAFSRKAGNA